MYYTGRKDDSLKSIIQGERMIVEMYHTWRKHDNLRDITEDHKMNLRDIMQSEKIIYLKLERYHAE